LFLSGRGLGNRIKFSNFGTH